MFCIKCGREIPENSKFCTFCGEPVYNTVSPLGNVNGAKTKGATHRKMIITLMIVVASAVAAVLLLSFAFVNRSRATRLQESLDLGRRYLNEENYKEALIAFSKAIEIDPKCEEAYLGAADSYVGMGDYKSAEELLKKGMEEIQNSVLLQKQQAGVEDRLREEETERKSREAFNRVVSDYKAQTADYAAAEFPMYSDYAPATWTNYPRIQTDDGSGLISSYVADFDKDGDEELLLISNESRQEHNQQGTPWQSKYLIGIMYEYIDDEPIVSATIDLVKYYESGIQGKAFISVKDSGTELLICTEYSDLSSVYADGSSYMFSAYKYNGNSFETIYTDDCAGSSFGDRENMIIQRFVDGLAKIGLSADSVPIYYNHGKMVTEQDNSLRVLASMTMENTISYQDWFELTKRDSGRLIWGTKRYKGNYD